MSQIFPFLAESPWYGKQSECEQAGATIIMNQWPAWDKKREENDFFYR
jgi:hypothetical protein